MKKVVIFCSVIVFLSLYSIDANAQDRSKTQDKKNNRGAAVNSNKGTPVKYIEYIVGTWKVEHVYRDNKDLSQTDTLAQDNEMMEFNRDGKYISYSDTEKIDSGLYRLNEEHGILYLESHAKGNPIEWTVTFNKNEMILQNKQTSARAERLKYVYSRQSIRPKH